MPNWKRNPENYYSVKNEQDNVLLSVSFRKIAPLFLKKRNTQDTFAKKLRFTNENQQFLKT